MNRNECMVTRVPTVSADYIYDSFPSLLDKSSCKLVHLNGELLPERGEEIGV